jgi:hypothetical protein
LLDKSDVVVQGEFTSEIVGESEELGVVHYQSDFKIAQLIKGDAAGERKVGGTIVVNAVRYEMKPADRLPHLTQGSKCLVFLNVNDRQSPPTYIISDSWLGILPASSTLAKTLSEMVELPPRQAMPVGLSAAGQARYQQTAPIAVAKEMLKRERVDTAGYRLEQVTVHAYCPPQPTTFDWLVAFKSRHGEDSLLVAVTDEGDAWQLHPRTLQRIGGGKVAVVVKEDHAAPPKLPHAQLAGKWRLFLPAGFEYAATLTAEKDDHYRLDPGGLAFGARYVVRGGYLMSVPVADEGVFKWKIQSPYLLTLVEQPAKSSSDYLGAVFVRLSPAAELRLEREGPDAAAARLPQTSLDELNRLMEAGQYTTVRQQKLGHQLESIGIVSAVGRTADWVLVDLPGKHWGGHLRNLHSQHGLQVGDKVAFRGILVDEAYAALTIWVYESHKVRDDSDEGASLKFYNKQSFQFHPQVPVSELKIELTPAKVVKRMQKHLILPLTIANRSQSMMKTKLAHEWHGGLWPPTAIYASITPVGDEERRPFQPVYRFGNDGAETPVTELAPGGSMELDLRMDWKGTGSVRTMPLMEASCKYTARFALVFEVAGQPQYVLTAPQLVELPEADHEK